MLTTEITLTDSQADALHRISESTGKSEAELVSDAIDDLLRSGNDLAERQERWREAVREAAGIWKDRDDLPDFEEMRREWDRSARWNEDE